MLLRTYKITKKSEIEKLAKTGRRLGSVFFIVKVKKNILNTTRWIIIVSTKVSKSAVKRNRLRRQIREIIRVELLEDNTSSDIMVVVKDNALNADFSALKDDLLKLYKKLKII